MTAPGSADLDSGSMGWFARDIFLPQAMLSECGV